MSEFTVNRITTVYYHINAIYFFSKSFWQERKLLKKFDIFFEEIVSKMKVKSLEKLNEDSESIQEKKFVDFLFDEKNGIGFEEAIDHVKAIVYGVNI